MRSAPVVAASILALAPLLTTTPSHAQDTQAAYEEPMPPDFARTGFYVGAEFDVFLDSYSGQMASFVGDFSGVGTDFSVDPGFGGSAIVGYRFHRSLAVEVQYTYLNELKGDLELSIPDASGTPGQPFLRTEMVDADVRGHLATVNLKAIYPGWGRYQPFASGGVGLMGIAVDAVSPTVNGVQRSVVGVERLAGKDVVFAGRLGGGLDVYLTEHLLLNMGASIIFTDYKTQGRRQTPEPTALRLVEGNNTQPNLGQPSTAPFQFPNLTTSASRLVYTDTVQGNLSNDSVSDFDHLYFWKFSLGLQFRF